MKYIIDIHNQGNQKRPYGNFIYDATITLEGSSPYYSDNLFKTTFQKMVCNYKDERLGGVPPWAHASLLEYKRTGNTAYMRAERYYDD